MWGAYPIPVNGAPAQFQAIPERDTLLLGAVFDAQAVGLPVQVRAQE